MNCDFNYCIFNQSCTCYFDEVGINALGMCDECTIVSIEEEKLEEYKRKQLQEIMSRYDDAE